VNEAQGSSDDRIAAELRGFGPIGILAIIGIFAGNLIVISLGGLLVLLWTRLSHTPWREIGYVRPESWARTVAVGIAFGIAFKFLMKAIVMPLFGAEPINQLYHYVQGNTAALPGILYAVTLGGGFSEETVYRGYAFERLGKLFGSAAWAKPLIVLLTTAVFAGLHYYDQGLAGVQQATITGLVFGTIFAVTGRVWMLMFAHAAFDWTALAIIYLGLENDVAHLVFK
jgi:membrane protease YdiL (CAAX protease family)